MFGRINALLFGVLIFIIFMGIISILMLLYLKKKMGQQKISSKLDKAVKNAKYKLTTILVKVDDVSRKMMISENGYEYTMTVEVFGTNFFDSLNVEKANINQVFISAIESFRIPFQFHSQSWKHNTDVTMDNYGKSRIKITKDIDELEIGLGVLETSIEDECEKLNLLINIDDDKKILSDEGNKEHQSKINTLKNGLMLLEEEKQHILRKLDAKKRSLKQTEAEMKRMNVLASNKENPNTRTYYVFTYNFNSSLYAAANLTMNEIKKKAFQELSAKANNLISNFESIGIKAQILQRYNVVSPLRKFFRPYLADKVSLESVYKETNITDVVTTTDSYFKLQQAANVELYGSTHLEDE